MDIVKNAFEQDGHFDLIKMLEENDTRVIEVFLQYQIPEAEAVSDLLQIEMAQTFKKDSSAIAEKFPQFNQIVKMISDNLSDKNADYDPNIMLKTIRYTTIEDFPFSQELLRCMTYYNSFYLDAIEYDVHAKDEDETSSEGSSSNASVDDPSMSESSPDECKDETEIGQKLNDLAISEN